MNLHCAIIEDVRPEAELLERTLMAAAEHVCPLHCTLFSDGGIFLRTGTAQSFDVIFLDICMPRLNGIETARRLREQNPKALIVFVTASPEYVWDALPLHPFDYLRKPYEEARIRTTFLRRCKSRSQSWSCVLRGS